MQSLKYEVIAFILSHYRSQHQKNTSEHLNEEAEGTATIIDRPLIALGSINPERLVSIAEQLSAVGLPGMVENDLIYKENGTSPSWITILIWSVAVIGGICLALLITAFATRRRLIQTTRTQQRMMDLAEEFFLFHARADGVTSLQLLSASSSLGRILGSPLQTYQKDSDALLRQIHPDDRHGLISSIACAIADRLPLRRRFRLLHPDHRRPRHLLLHAMPLPGSDPVEFDGLVLDLTTETEATEALIETQQRLERTQRNESLGLLAGGVAHDFNNLLGGIRGNAELALAQLPPEHAARPRIDRLLQAADRAAGLVRQILAYAGRGSIEIRPIDITEECRTLLDLLKHSIAKNITLKLEAQDKIPPVLFDPAQLQQVLINLMVNAAESYQGEPGVVLVHLSRSPDRRVEVVIEDHGCGMDDATQARMFEPYFTTKKSGHGLGLAAVQGIIKATGAEMFCQSKAGVGTTFTLKLNAAKTPSQNLTPQLAPTAPGGRHILVVDVESEDVGVLPDAVGVGALRKHRIPLLDGPTQQDLGLVHTVLFGHDLERGVR